MNRSLMIPMGAVLALAAPSAALAAPPANDAFATPQALGLPASVPGTVEEATSEPTDPNLVGSRRSESVWYSFTAPQTQALAVDTCTAEFDSVIGVFTGTAPGSLRRVAENDDACGQGSRVTFNAVAGQSYRILVASLSELQGDASGTFRLSLRPLVRPRNDAFAQATRLSRPGRVRGSTVLASKELGEPAHSRGAEGHSVWYRYRAPRTQTLTADTFGSDYDTVLAVYRGDLGRLRKVADNDDARGGGGEASEARFRVRRGLTYFIAVDGVGDATGDFELGLSDGGARGVGLGIRVLDGQTLNGARTDGLSTSVRCVRRCRVRVEARIGATTARRLGLGRRPLAIARLEGRLGGDDPERTAVLRFSREARAALRGERRLDLSVVARLRGTDARDRSISRRVTLTNPAS